MLSSNKDGSLSFKGTTYSRKYLITGDQQVDEHNARRVAAGLDPQYKTTQDKRNQLRLDQGLEPSRDVTAVYKQYDNYLADADKQIADIDSQISALEKEISELNKKSADAVKAATGTPTMQQAMQQAAGTGNRYSDLMVANAENTNKLKELNSQLLSLNQQKEKLNANKSFASESKDYTIATLSGDADLINDYYQAYYGAQGSAIKSTYTDPNNFVAQSINAMDRYNAEEKLSKTKSALTDKGYTDEQLQSFINVLNTKAAEERTAEIKAWTEKNGLNAALGTAASIATAPVRGAVGLMGMVYDAGTKNSPYNVLSEFSSTVQGTIRDGIQSSVSSWATDAFKSEKAGSIIGTAASMVYQAGVSSVESYINMNLGGALGELLMSMDAASSTYYDAVNNGMSTGSAVATALASGVFEAVFEHLSLENLRVLKESTETGLKTVVKNVLKSFFTEGSEEVFTDIANEYWDYWTNGGLSAYSKFVDSYLEENPNATKEEAEKAYKRQFLQQLGESMVVGGLSGAMHAGAYGLRNEVRQARVDTAVGKAVNKMAEGKEGGVKEVLSPLTEQVKQNAAVEANTDKNATMDAQTAKEQARQQRGAEKAERQYNKGIESKSNRKLGKAVGAAMSSVSETQRRTMQEALTEELGMDEADAADYVDKYVNAILGGEITLENVDAVTSNEDAFQLMQELTSDGTAQSIETLRNQISAGAVKETLAYKAADKYNKWKNRDALKKQAAQEDINTKAKDAVTEHKTDEMVTNAYDVQTDGGKGKAGAVTGITDGKLNVVIDADTKATATLDTLTFSDESAAGIYRTVQDMMTGAGDYNVKMSADGANLMLASVQNNTSKLSDAEFMAQFYTAYKAGSVLRNKNRFMNETEYDLDEKILNTAYIAGAATYAVKPGVTRIGTRQLTKLQSLEIAGIDRVFEKRGLKMIVTDALKTTDTDNGISDTVHLLGEQNDDVIVVALGRDEKNNVLTLSAYHELFHWMGKQGEKGANYQAALQDAVLRYVKSRGDISYEDMVQQRLDVGYSREEIDEEIAAQYFGAAMAQRGWREENAKKDPGLWQKIVDHVKEFLQEVKEALKNRHGEDLAVRSALETDIETLDTFCDMFQATLDALTEERAESTEKKTEKESAKNKGTKYSYAGVGSATADKTMLQQAEQMEQDGEDSETIRQETGWFRGYDGKWRFEINDNNMKFDLNGLYMRNPDVRRYNTLMQKFLYDMPTQEEIAELKALEPNLKGVNRKPEVLGDMIEHSELLDAYPQLADISVKFGTLDDASGTYYPRSNEIYIHENLLKDTERMKKTLLHEIQHAIQHIEGFANGSNEFYWAGVISPEEIRKKAEAEIREIMKDVPKDLRNKYDRYQDLDRVLTELLLADGDLDEEKYTHYDEIQDALYEELHQYDWFRQLQYAEGVLNDPGEAYESLYKRTAGEVEARDTAARADLTAAQRKETRPDIDRTDVVFADGSRTSYEIRKISEDNVRESLVAAANGEFNNDTYIPLRRNTPEVFRRVVENHSKGQTILNDLPMVSSVKHIQQVMEEDDGGIMKGGKRPHGLDEYDIIDIVKAMDDPAYIVLQQNGRYAEIVRIRSKNKEIIASIENHADYKHAQYMNDYGEGYYNTVVTLFSPDDLKSYLSKNEIVYDKKKGIAPVGSGRIVAFTQLQSPFDDNITQRESESQESKQSRDIDTDGRELSKEQQAYFADSKVRDEDGRLQVVYHGTDADFYTFDTKVSGGSHGNAEGYGIYLTDDPEVSSKYGDRQIKGYANIKRPAYGFRKTITQSELAKLIRATCEKEAEQFVEDGEYGSVPEALRDTWVSNYVITYDYANMRDVYADVAKNILKLNDNDADIVYEVMNGQAIRSYDRAMAFYNDVLTPTTGIDGIWQIWENKETGEKSNIYLAFDSNQIKETTNKTPTESKDIRYSRDIDEEYMAAVKSGDEETEARLVEEAARKAGYTDKMYHGTQKFGFTFFDKNYSDDGYSFFAAGSARLAGSYSGWNGVRDIGNKDITKAPIGDVMKRLKTELPEGYIDTGNGYKTYEPNVSYMSVSEKENFEENAKKRFLRVRDRLKKVDLGVNNETISIVYYINLLTDLNHISQAVNDHHAHAARQLYEKYDVIKKHLDNDIKDDLDKLSYEMDVISSFDFKKNDSIFVVDYGEYTSEGRINVFAEKEVREKLNDEAGNYALYGKPGKQLVIDGQSSYWFDVRDWNKGLKDSASYGNKTRDIAQYAKEHGYDSVRIDNIIDSGGRSRDVFSKEDDDGYYYEETGTVFVYFDSERLKSADLITYDDDGNVIPLSERFNPEKEDIRYSRDIGAEADAYVERLKGGSRQRWEIIDIFKDMSNALGKFYLLDETEEHREKWEALAKKYILSKGGKNKNASKAQVDNFAHRFEQAYQMMRNPETTGTVLYGLYNMARRQIMHAGHYEKQTWYDDYRKAFRTEDRAVRLYATETEMEGLRETFGGDGGIRNITGGRMTLTTDKEAADATLTDFYNEQAEKTGVLAQAEEPWTKISNLMAVYDAKGYEWIDTSAEGEAGLETLEERATEQAIDMLTDIMTVDTKNTKQFKAWTSRINELKNEIREQKREGILQIISQADAEMAARLDSLSKRNLDTVEMELEREAIKNEYALKEIRSAYESKYEDMRTVAEGRAMRMSDEQYRRYTERVQRLRQEYENRYEKQKQAYNEQTKKIADEAKARTDEQQEWWKGRYAESKENWEKKYADQQKWWREYYKNKLNEKQQWYQDALVKDTRQRQIRRQMKQLTDIFTNDKKNKFIPEQMQSDLMGFIRLFSDDRHIITSEGVSKLINVINNNMTGGVNVDAGTLFQDFDADLMTSISELLNDLRKAEEEKTIERAAKGLAPTEKKAIGINGKVYTQFMTVDQLNTLLDVITNIRHVIESYNTIEINGKRTQMDEKMREMRDYCAKQKKHNKKWLDNWIYDVLNVKMLTPIYMFNERVGSVMSEMYEDLRDGQDQWMAHLIESMKFITEAKDKYKYKEWKDKKITLHFDETLTRPEWNPTLTMDAALQIWVTAKRQMEGGMDSAHLNEGGIILAKDAEAKETYRAWKKAQKNSNTETSTAARDKNWTDFINEQYSATRHQLTVQEMLDIEKKIKEIAPEALDYADAGVKFLSSTCSEWGNEASVKLTGLRKFNEKYYFPYQSASDYLHTRFGAGEDARLKNIGFTKSLVPNGSTPLMITGFTDVMTGHMEQMARYAAFAVPLDNFSRVMNYHERVVNEDGEITRAADNMKTMIKNTYGKNVLEYINGFLTQMNGGPRGDDIDSMLNRTTSWFKRGAVMGNVSVVAQQPSAIMRAMAMVNPIYFGHLSPGEGGILKGEGLHLIYKDYKNMMEHSMIANVKKMGGFDTGMGTSAKTWLNEENTWKQELPKILGVGAELADAVTWTNIWNAVRRETNAKYKDVEYGSEEYYDIVNKRFRDVIDYTQVYDSTLSKNAFMRSPSALAKMATAFMAEPSLSYNLLTMSGSKKKGRTVGKAAAIAAFVGNVMVNAALKALVTVQRDKDDDETWIEAYLRRFMNDVFGNREVNVKGKNWPVYFLDGSLSPLTMIPVLKDIISLYEGYDVERSDVSVFGDLINAVRKFINIYDEESVPTWKDWVDFITSFSLVTTVPVQRLWKDIDSAWDLYSGLLKGKDKYMTTTGYTIEGAIKEGLGFTTEDAKKAYDAVMNNDQETLNRMLHVDEERQAKNEAKFRDEDKAAQQSDVEMQKKLNKLEKQGLAENDDRVQQAAQALNNRNYSLYEELIGSMEADGFTHEAVQSAVDEAVEALRPAKEEKVSKIAEVPMYGYDDLDAAIDANDATSIEYVKQQLIKQGKTESTVNKHIKQKTLDMLENDEISAKSAEDFIVKYTDIEKDKATDYVEFNQYKAKHPDTELDVDSWGQYTKVYERNEKSFKELGIEPEVFEEYYVQQIKCKGTDLDGDGKTDNDSVKKQVLPIIDALDISPYQKDAIYLSRWAETNKNGISLKDTPWQADKKK